PEDASRPAPSGPCRRPETGPRAEEDAASSAAARSSDIPSPPAPAPLFSPRAVVYTSIPRLSRRKRGAEAIEDVMAERIARQKAGVVKVLGRVVPHAKPLHHGPRARVAGRREGDDLLEAGSPKAEVERRVPGLRRIAATPNGPGQAPADL